MNKKKIINGIVAAILYLFGIISSVLTIKQRNTLGKIIGDLLRILSSKRKDITLTNLKLAFPDKNQDWINRTMNDSYRSLGITLSELLVLKNSNMESLKKYIRYENIEMINEIHSRGKGLILMSGHYGNWEYLAYSGGYFSGIPFLIVVHPQSNDIADRILNDYRTKGGNKVIPMGQAAREIIRTIREGGAIAMLADQAATSDKDIFVNFFGYPSATFEAPASIALRYDVPIIVGFAERQPDCTYYVKLTELKHDDLKFSKEGILELTKRHVGLLEDAIRKNPGLWAWQHRKWKHTDFVNY